ncbi:site-specific integrase [Sphingomonas sp. BE137]|uniref:tyrosine-type recombinase/integrase n=1 Tax=Sphingomonas sp. BE137 TaxID=2817844 RepID=UPI001AE104E6|nr:site-specific integrase [Sphingomonas sp. BE137]MDR6850375.1 integrase [Sphingomonas sp. BE137]
MASVSKRARKKADGSNGDKWVLRYKDRSGSYRQETFDRKKDADAACAKVKMDLLHNEHIAKSQQKTIAVVAEAYITHVEDAAKRGAMRQTTVSGYVQRINTMVIPHLANTAVNELEPREIELWIAKLRAEGFAPKTVGNCISLLKLMIDLAIRYRWARSNPVLAIASDVRRARTEPIRQFRLEDIRTLLATAATRYPKAKRRPTATLQCFVTLAAFLGLRWGEIAGLQRKNVDLDSGILRVRTSLSRFRTLYDPKTKAGRRDVRMPTMIRDLMTAYLTDFPSEGPEGLVFSTACNNPISYASWWQKSWTKLLDRAGLSSEEGGLHFHALRHFAASWMIENGWPLPDVANQLGHANVSTTMQTYAHSIEKRSQSLEAVDALANRLSDMAIVSVTPSVRAIPLRTSDARELITL